MGRLEAQSKPGRVQDCPGVQAGEAGLGQRELAPVCCLTFQAQVAFQAHWSFISLFSFNVLHPGQDKRRWSWRAPVPSVSWKEAEFCHFPRPLMVRESITKLVWSSELCVEHRNGGSGEPQPWEAAGATAREHRATAFQI